MIRSSGFVFSVHCAVKISPRSRLLARHATDNDSQLEPSIHGICLSTWNFLHASMFKESGNLRNVCRVVGCSFHFSSPLGDCVFWCLAASVRFAMEIEP